MTIKAIQTQYKGYHFRSRLEARWAVFFDALGLEWEYEPEGFDLGDGVYYLPDFKVTNKDGSYVWYEIKAGNVGGCEKFDKFEKLVRESSKIITDPEAIMLSGDPHTMVLNNASPYVGICPRCCLIGNSGGWDYNYSYYPEEIYAYDCQQCDGHTPCGGSDMESGALCDVTPWKGTLEVLFLDYHDKYFPKITAACNAARSARFEHGESGATL